MIEQLDRSGHPNERFWEDGAYFQSWYPLCLSAELAAKPIGKEFLGTRVVVYRDADGQPVVQSGYCPHLGADLSLGAVIDGELRCAYHYWRFARDGRCTHIPALDKPPLAARIFSYPAAERWGLIWAFNGETPLTGVPSLLGVNEDEVLFRVTQRPGVQPVDSWIPTTNSVDFQHLISVHDFPPVSVPTHLDIGPLTLGYRSSVLGVEGQGLVVGQNTFSTHNLIPLPFENWTLFTGNAVAPGKLVAFFVTAVPKPGSEAERAQAHANLDALSAFSENLYVEDEALLNTIRFRRRGDARLVKTDAALGQFLNYLEKLPRARPFDT